jgi:SpoVK/Ycf46/Vps4 family AAA+-type ATPase
MGEIGGMEILKQWMSVRKKAFSEEAKKFGVETPKGVMLVGIQGCGKSHMAKAIASTLSLPLVRFDVAKVFSKTVGSSEENIRTVISLIEAVSPCVLMIDEIEKGLAGIQSSNQSDGGTTARVVGTLLSWLNDKTSPVFIVATANNIQQLPPELQRKGRFDELFFVPLPEESERAEIFSIHLRKRNRNPEDFNIAAFAKASEFFSGAECEEAIRAALIDAFDKGEPLSDTHILASIRSLIPLFHTCREDLEYLYKWVGWNKEKKDGIRARFASSARKKAAEAKGSNVILFESPDDENAPSKKS